MAQYGKAEYWDERYTRDPEPFDWYQRWSGIREICASYMKTTSNILVVGAGNSRVSEEMYEDGYQKLTNIDISMVAMKAMAEKHKDKGIPFIKMDMRKMDLENGTFDVVFDKGTLDSILCGEASTLNVQSALSEINRVLDPKGVYICVSHAQPSYRLTYLQRQEFGWNVVVHTVAKPIMGLASAQQDDKDNIHYIYVCTKDSSAKAAAPGA